MGQLVFYGTSGWFETSQGATSCVGLHLDECVILFDLGTGLSRLPPESVRGRPLIVVLSHLHLDHSYGLHILPRLKPSSLTLLTHRALAPHLKRLLAWPFTKPAEGLGYPVQILGLKNERLSRGSLEIDIQALEHNTPVIGASVHTPDACVTYCVDTVMCHGLESLTRAPGTLILETAPPPDVATNGHHLTLDQQRVLLTNTRADRVVLTHFGATKFPSAESRARQRQALEGSHSNLLIAHDGLELDVPA